MHTNPKLFELLYVSTLAPDVSVSVVADIAARSRAWNSQVDITGLLIFDGMRFCQQIEGQQKPLLSLVERITADARHSNITIFHHGELSERRFKNWSLAFSNVEDTDALARLEKLDGKLGVEAFVELLATLEFDG